MGEDKGGRPRERAPETPAQRKPGEQPRDQPKHQRDLFGEFESPRSGGDPSEPGESGTGRGDGSIPPGRGGPNGDEAAR